MLLPLARGGMGVVYLARIPELDRRVAIKVMHLHLREDPNFASELIEEAKLAGKIHHPNVVPVLDADEDEDGVFLVMDYVEGDSISGLQRMLDDRGEGMPERIGLRILVDALRGLHAAHELRDEAGELVGLVHRDFTPHNILVGVDGVTRLTDFGVAKAATRNSHTATGLIKGKLHYMPPEQARSDPLDRRSDVWSAGVILWELLAHERMYAKLTDTAVLMTLITEDPPPLASVRPDAPEAFAELCRWALTRDADERCPSAEALADAIEAAAPAFGGLAPRPEVGRFVEGLAGDVLAERRARVAELVGSPPREVADPVTKLDEPTTFEPHHAAGRPPAPAGSWLRASTALLAGVVVVVGGMEAREALAPASPATASAEVQSAPSRTVTLVSAVPLVAVTVGERRLTFPEPKTKVEVVVTGAEARLEAHAVDGRRAAVEVAGSDEVEVEFDPAEAPAP